VDPSSVCSMKLLSLIPFVLHLLLAKLALAGKFKESGLRPKHLHRPRHSTNEGQVYELKDLYKGQNFLECVFLCLVLWSFDSLVSTSEWDFFTAEDPTHGNVNFQARDAAIRKNLAFVQPDGTAVLAVDDFSDVPVGGRRDS
jgi:hypothetical protein